MLKSFEQLALIFESGTHVSLLQTSGIVCSTKETGFVLTRAKANAPMPSIRASGMRVTYKLKPKRRRYATSRIFGKFPQGSESDVQSLTCSHASDSCLMKVRTHDDFSESAEHFFASSPYSSFTRLSLNQVMIDRAFWTIH